MKKNYNIIRRMVAYVLLVSFLLQSCNSNISLKKESIRSDQNLMQRSPRSDANKEAYTYTIHSGAKLQIEQRGEDSQGTLTDNNVNFSQMRKNIPVTVEKGTYLQKLTKLPTALQQRRIQVGEGSVTIMASGLKGAGDTKEKKKDKGKEKAENQGNAPFSTEIENQTQEAFENLDEAIEAYLSQDKQDKAKKRSIKIQLKNIKDKLLKELKATSYDYFKYLYHVKNAAYLRAIGDTDNADGQEMLAKNLEGKYINYRSKHMKQDFMEAGNKEKVELEEELQLAMIDSGTTTQTTTSTGSLLKVNPKLVPYPKEVVREEIKNNLPVITYNYEKKLSVLNKIPMEETVKREAVLYLETIRGKVQEIESYQGEEDPEVHYSDMQGCVLLIDNTIEELYKLTEHYHDTLPNTLKRLIVASLATFKADLRERSIMTVKDKEELQFKTNRLCAEQSYIAREGLLENHLFNIRTLLTKPGNPSPCCYISYAWPSLENKETEYFVQPFLTTLYNHLTAAGVRMVMDIRDNKPGASIYEFMGRYRDGNPIILVGTESLLQKHYSPVLHAVKTELSIINRRHGEDQKVYGNSRIYPMLLSGNMHTSFPEVYDKNSTVKDAREQRYVLLIKNLLDWLYKNLLSKVQEGYNKLWQEVESKYPELYKPLEVNKVKKELSLGYHHKRLDQLKEESQYKAVQAQEQTKHSDAVGAKMVGVLMESQGLNPKGLYAAFGKQYQRPSITLDFIEREKLWDKMVTHFNFNNPDQQILTLSAQGLGGMGKTELARHYYLNPPNPYTLRAWFNAENKDQLYAEYVELGKSYGIDFSEKAPIQEQAMHIKRWLERQKDCLLVYDNALGSKELEGVLPEEGKHHILITSRNSVGWPAHQQLEVDVMEEGEAIDLICKITGCKKDTPGIKDLVNILQYMPLALAQAGAYMAEKKTSIRKYLDRYSKYKAELLGNENLSKSPKHAAVWVTFNMNFKALKKKCPSALTTLKQASWLAASVIPEILLESMIEGSKDEHLDLLWDDVKGYISRYSLMRIDAQEEKLSMHRLVQDILRSQQQKAESKNMLEQIAVSIKDVYPKNDKTRGDIALVKLLLSHMEILLFHLKPFFNERECADFNLKYYLGDTYYTLGNYIKAEEHFLTNLLVQQTIDEVNHSEVATSLSSIGNVYESLGKHQKALKYLKEALVMKKSIYGVNHPEIATLLNNIGTVYDSLGKHQKALKYLDKALIMKRNIYEGIHPSIAASLSSIGNVYYTLGEDQRTLKYLEEGLKMKEAIYRGNHPSIATSLHNIGNVYSRSREHQKALEYFKKALVMKQDIYPGDHSSVAISLGSIGNVYSRLGEHQKALKYLEEALVMERVIYPGNHLEVATSLGSIGNVYSRLGKHQKALKYLEEGLKMKEAIYEGNHPSIATSLNNIGAVYYSLGKHQEALKYLEEGLVKSQAIYEGNHPSVASSFHNIGNVYYSLREDQKALKHLEKALVMCKAIYPENHPSVASLLGIIKKVYDRLEEHQKGEQKI